MECFLRSIDFNAREDDVKLAIANALHGGNFAEFGPEKINFQLRLHRNKRGGGRSHGGTGSLTLPQVAIGNAFVRRYGSGQLSVNGRPIIVTVSRNPVRQEFVQTLRLTPYPDPQSEAEQQRTARAETLSDEIDVVQIDQGWVGRDSSFLSEYALKLTETIKTMSLKFDDANRSIELSITSRVAPRQPATGFQSLLHQLTGVLPWESSTYYIKFRYSDIDYILIDRDADINVVLFQLRTPVSYERETSQFESLLSFDGKRAPRSRLSSLKLDEKHASLARYVSRSVLIRIGRPAAQKFLKLRKIAQIAHPQRHHIQIVDSTMFAPSKILALEDWIADQEWEIAFQLEKIMNNMLLNPEEFLALKPQIEEILRTSPTEHVVAVLLDFISRLEILDRDDYKNEMMNREMRTARQCLDDAIQKASKPTLGMSRLRTARRKGINGDFPCLHVVVTPTRMILEGPSPEQLNRVLRMYPDNWNNFLRVRFSDEDQSSFRWDPDVDVPALVKRRVGGILKKGLVIAGRRFEYLGYSSSALKTHTVWFVQPFELPGLGVQDAAAIIRKLGDFSRDEQYPARMGARIAQAFSSTDLSISATVEEIIVSPDIERNGSCFTDGVGTISPEVAKQIWRSLNKLRKRRSFFLPAAYQVRLGGHKGMLAIDYRLEGSVICVRKSMDKFDSASLDIEVARAFDRPSPCFLNRPLIMILETANKIEPGIFLRLQQSAVKNTRESMRTFLGATKLLEIHGLGASFKLPSILVRLQNIGLELEHCHSLGIKTALKDAETDILRELKHRARIPVPDSWKLVGIADEFEYLKQGEIYACVRDKDEQPIYLEGPYMISRSPAIHPGDVQVVRAIGKPPPGTPFDIEPLANTVVLSCDGERSLASCLGGGDLDGDLYDLINLTAWPDLAPREVSAPAEYPPAPKKAIVGRKANIDDVKEFICDFITSDMVGKISVQHLKMADYLPLGVCDPDCLTLAALHSKAVDFPKSGTPVNLSELPRFSGTRPDWDAGELGYRNTQYVYPSTRALGQLHRAIQLNEDKLQRKGTYPSSQFGTELDITRHAKPLERAKRDLIYHHLRAKLAKYIYVDEVPRECFEAAVELLEEYISELTRICNTYALTSRSILSEEEVVAGTILEPTSQHRRRRDMISEMRTASTSLVANVKDVLRGSDSDELEDWMLRSWAAYQVARGSDEFGHNSFGLLAFGNAFEAVEAITQRDTVR